MIRRATKEETRVLLTAHLPALNAYARRLAGAEADDLVQDACLKVLRYFGSFRIGTNFAAWLSTICKRAWLDGRRRRASEPAADGGMSHAWHGSEAAPSAEPAVDVGDDRFARAWRSLRPTHRRLLSLKAEGYTYSEIREATGMPPGTIMSGMHRARLAFKAEFFSSGEGA